MGSVGKLSASIEKAFVKEDVLLKISLLRSIVDSEQQDLCYP